MDIFFQVQYFTHVNGDNSEKKWIYRSEKGGNKQENHHVKCNYIFNLETALASLAIFN